MSNRKLKARDKRTLKNTRDGLVERNIVTGEDVKVTEREAEQDLRTKMPQDDIRLSKAVSTTKPSHKRQQRQYRQSRETEPTAQVADNRNTADTPAVQTQQSETAVPLIHTDNDDVRYDEQSPQAQSGTERVFYPTAKSKPPPKQKRQYENLTEHRTAQPEQSVQTVAHTKRPAAEPEVESSSLRQDAPSKLNTEAPQSVLQSEPDSALRHEHGEAAQSQPEQNQQRRYASKGQPAASANGRTVEQSNTTNVAEPIEAETAQTTPSPSPSPLKQDKTPKLQAETGDIGIAPVVATAQRPKPSKQQPRQQVASEQSVTPNGVTRNPVERTDGISDNSAPAVHRKAPPREPDVPQTDSSELCDTKPDTLLKEEKPETLQFSSDEAEPPVLSRSEAKQTKKLGKAQTQADKAVTKLDKAKSKLPAKKKLRSKRVFNEESGKAKRKLYFESEVKSQAEHLKGALPLRPVKAATNLTIVNAHRKLYQVERENVATEAAHKGEIIAESGVRSALRFANTAPYRKVEKLERAATKKTVNLAYQKALAENPKLQSNVFSRMAQKRKIKKDYAKAARDAKKNAERVKKAGSKVSEAAKAIGGAVKRHPIAAAVIVLICLLMFSLMSLIGAFGGMGSGGLGGILSASYLADDQSIDNAELYYTEWEADLQERIANTETDYPDYDEYRYNVGEISHNPYELMAYLTVKYRNFSYDAISADLQALFGEQYSLTFTPTSETRYADPTDADEDGDYEPYEYKIMTVTLTARNFSEVVAAHLSGEETAHFALLLETKGSRQYLANPFDFEWLSYVSSYYGYRIHPISGVKDIHRGVDIAVPLGTEIHSGQDGTVTFAGNSGGYGNVVIIENGDGLVSKYAHCDTLSVTAGQNVKSGDVIATVGNTGNSTGPHLHLEVMKNGEYLNPAYFADTGTFNLTPTYGYAGEPMGDGSYAALMEVALQFEGFPYVWGGSSPETSFDCSGLVSYCLRASGVKDVGRLTAQGLYNISTPVSASEAKPGDLVFFHSTYSAATPVTHVGIYCGNNLMYDAGDPIGYTRIDTAYWQSHFYAFGRIN